MNNQLKAESEKQVTHIGTGDTCYSDIKQNDVTKYTDTTVDTTDLDVTNFEDFNFEDLHLNGSNLDTFLDNLVTDSTPLKSSDDLQALHKSDIDNMQEHAKSYSTLLQEYTKHIENTLKFKRFAKKTFFWIVTTLLVLTVLFLISAVLLVCVWVLYSNIDVTEYVAVIITAFASALGTFISAIIVIPKIVAKYLFNREEENNIANIVKNMQKYDKDIRDKL